jgi:hypothetical protein
MRRLIEAPRSGAKKRAGNRRASGKEDLLFVNKKVPKTLLFWARATSTPQAQTNKSFCAAFFKKRLLS